ncbi:hypothetical protein MRB53_038292 [Persea americana]|nr:hypothetical protein MRB53_038292 [Persea americana]
MAADSGAFTRIELPQSATQDDIDTFETILAQCTAFLERAPAPVGDKGYKTYSPADWAAGGKLGGGKTKPGQLVLVDEEDGSVVGELDDAANIIEDAKLSHGTKVAPASEEYLRLSQHPAYRDSSLVQNAAAASRLIVTSSTYLGGLLSSKADNFVQTTKPNPKPMEFGPATHEHVRRLHSFTQSSRTLSAKTVGSATKYAQNIGAAMARRGEKARKGYDEKGRPIEDYKPGLLNKSMIAFSTIADGIAESGRNILNHSSAAATTVVNHKYGPEAGSLAADVSGGIKNVGLVYIDVTGVSRRAVIKSVAKGMVVGRVKGQQVIVGGGDGGVVPEKDLQRAAGNAGVKNDNMGPPGKGEFGVGNASGAPPQYTSELGEPMGSSNMKGYNTQI